MYCLLAGIGACLRYKYNGENWLVEADEDTRVTPPVAREFRFKRRCDSKPKPIAQQLRNNITNLPALSCSPRPAEAAVSTLGTARSCAHCGALSGDMLAAHIARDAVAAAQSTGEPAQRKAAISTKPQQTH